MNRFARSHLSDQVLLHSAATNAARERRSAADLLADLAEIDARKLYRPAAYPSMFAYCMGELRLSEDAAFRRITAARTARRFRGVFQALAEGRLHLSGVGLLAPHLTEANADELLAAAAHKSKTEIERLLAERFPLPDVLAWVTPIHSDPGAVQAAEPAGEAPQLVPERVGTQLVPERVGDRPKVKPLSARSFEVTFTMSGEAREMLSYAQALLGHQVPSGDIAAVFERALAALIPQLEKAKFAATTRPRQPHGRRSENPRHIPAHVRRAAWKRDQGQCTFVSETGHRCPARKPLEFDHVDPVARGGEATVEGVRLRCRAHNQYAAECTFGAEFMRHKRIAAAEARAAVRARAAAGRAPLAANERTVGVGQARDRDVVPWLRALGYRRDEARRAAELCDDMPDATLEERVRVALTGFLPEARGSSRPRARPDQPSACRTLRRCVWLPA